MEKGKLTFAVPSTPTQLNDKTFKFMLGEGKKKITTGRISYMRESYARSLCGLPAYLITISGDRKNGIMPSTDRKCVIITNRTHPGETTGSYVVEGLLNYLLCMA